MKKSNNNSFLYKKKKQKRSVVMGRLIKYLGKKYAKFEVWHLTKDFEQERIKFEKEKSIMKDEMDNSYQRVIRIKEDNFNDQIHQMESRLLKDINDLNIQKNNLEYLLEEEKSSTRKAQLSYIKAEENYIKHATVFRTMISRLGRFETFIADTVRFRGELRDAWNNASKEIEEKNSNIQEIEERDINSNKKLIIKK